MTSSSGAPPGRTQAGRLRCWSGCRPRRWSGDDHPRAARPPGRVRPGGGAGPAAGPAGVRAGLGPVRRPGQLRDPLRHLGLRPRRSAPR
ncbi:MAG: hypothetical protein MZV63_37420 [Marinilabiliales bacterium]|nr:hypothetical protein [Marinilabiliales bacterium]